MEGWLVEDLDEDLFDCNLPLPPVRTFPSRRSAYHGNPAGTAVPFTWTVEEDTDPTAATSAVLVPCHKCGSIAEKLDNLIATLPQHANRLPEVSAGSSSAATAAVTSDSDESDLPCPKCSNNYKTISGLKRHIANVHHECTTACFKCPICEECVRTESNLAAHTAKAHAPPLRCPACRRLFKRKACFLKHRCTGSRYGTPADGANAAGADAAVA